MKRAALDNAYDASGSYLGRIWSTRRDVPVQEHVAAILRAVDPALPDRLAPALLRELIEAYSRPILMVPPSVDDGARTALEALRERGYTLALISNTMRTPGVTLRKLLARYRLLDCFAHTTFSDEVGIRKPDPAIFVLTLRAGLRSPARGRRPRPRRSGRKGCGDAGDPGRRPRAKLGESHSRCDHSAAVRIAGRYRRARGALSFHTLARRLKTRTPPASAGGAVAVGEGASAAAPGSGPRGARSRR